MTTDSHTLPAPEQASGTSKAATATAPVIELRDVCFAYGTDVVLHNVSFTVHQHDMAAFVGPNGGGKTTLLYLILGLHKPRFGSVQVFGGSPELARKRIGYVPQQMLFDPQFPVNAFDVVQMGRVERHWAGPYRKPDREAVVQALEQVDMADMRKRAFAELSGGERQRVLIAQALATGPDLLLLDEPTANVDTVVESKIYELLQKLHQNLTIVLVSHNLNLITSFVNRVVCVNRTAEIHPAEALTADVIRQAYGGRMAILKHNPHCHILDPSGLLRTPHRGAPAEEQ